MLEELKEKVMDANLELVRRGMTIHTWGNVSQIDRERNLVVIKPSGVAYDSLRPRDMVVVDLEGMLVEGECNPSSDTPTHLVLYREFGNIGAVAHSHSPHATMWAQARRPLPALGTTHADYFHGEVPLTRPMTVQEINGDYELETGKVITECFRETDPHEVPGVLVHSHGPFTWGADAAEAVHHMTVLEEVARMALGTLSLNPSVTPMDKALLDKHYLRKHGRDSYYGQEKSR